MIALGHLIMAFEASFLFALLAIILGSGLFTPNISAQVGMLYASGDDRRDSGYSLFYLGINIGAFLAPLACGTTGEVYGWHYAFALAANGVTAGLIIYALNTVPLPLRAPAVPASDHVPATRRTLATDAESTEPGL